jgi:BirA family transcriptional regulator, biotin operon repressor / biotin---[acetyl-CoA-carboxylase] ligase
LNTVSKNIIKLPKVNSTNEYAISLLKSNNIVEGTVIWAFEQSAGKGQGENKWESEPGKNLTFSLILHPAFLPPEKQFFLNEVVALGVLDFTGICLPSEKNSLKWPNDIYSGNRKLGGILINNIISGKVFETSIAGIGLNINQTVFSSRIPNPVSLKMLLHKETELEPALKTICQSIERRYRQLQDDRIKEIHDDYCKNLLGYNTWRNFSTGEKQMEGKLVGVTETGRLLVETRDSQLVEFDHHQIEYIF